MNLHRRVFAGLSVLALGGCTFSSTATHWNGRVGPDGRPVPAVDFMSTIDTPWPWELNMWYHTLNVGFRTATAYRSWT